VKGVFYLLRIILLAATVSGNLSLEKH